MKKIVCSNKAARSTTVLSPARRIVVSAALVLGVLVSATTAGAASGPTTTTLPFSLPSGGGSLAAQYNSLAGGMINYWASQNQMSLSQFVQSNAGTLASLVGAQSAASLAQAASSGSLTMPQLDSLLGQSAPTINLTGVTSMTQLMNTLAGSQSSVDGQAILTGTQIASLLQAQQTGQPAPTVLATPSSDSMIFGVFYDQTLKQMMNSSPGLIGQVEKSGLGSAAAQAAWNKTLAAASKASQTSLSSLPDPCGMVLLQSMGSGQATSTSGACSPCAVAGTYLHSQLGKMFNPASNSVLPSSTTVNSSSWTSMQNWLQQATIQQNSGVASAVSGDSTAASAGNACAGSSNASAGVLSSTLPGVFANLGR